MMRMSKLLSAIRLSPPQEPPIERSPDWACNAAYNTRGNIMTRSVMRIAAATLLLCLSQAAFAAELKVYSTIGVKSAIEELAPTFEKATGNTLTISWPDFGLHQESARRRRAGGAHRVARRNRQPDQGRQDRAGRRVARQV